MQVIEQPKSMSSVNHVLNNLSPLIGQYLDLKTRRNCTLSFKGFEKIHQDFTFQIWHVKSDDEFTPRNKLDALLKQKPRLHTLQIHFYVPISVDKLQVLFDETRIDMVAIFIENNSNFLSTIINAATTTTTLPKHIHLSSLQDYVAKHQDVVKAVRMQLDKSDTSKVLRINCLPANVLNVLKPFSCDDLKRINMFEIDNYEELDMVENNEEIVQKLCAIPKVVFTSYINADMYATMLKTATLVYDAYIINYNQVSIRHVAALASRTERLERVYFANFRSSDAILDHDKLIKPLVNSKIKQFDFWDNSLTDVALFIVCKELVDKGKIVQIHVDRQDIDHLVCSILQVRKCKSRGIDVLTKPTEYDHLSNDELFNMMQNRYLAALWSST